MSLFLLFCAFFSCKCESILTCRCTPNPRPLNPLSIPTILLLTHTTRYDTTVQFCQRRRHRLRNQ